jgi:hypothetical protein
VLESPRAGSESPKNPRQSSARPGVNVLGVDGSAHGDDQVSRGRSRCLSLRKSDASPSDGNSASKASISVMTVV